jgi:hypothetical protein
VAEGLPGFTHHTHARSRLFAHGPIAAKRKGVTNILFGKVRNVDIFV